MTAIEQVNRGLSVSATGRRRSVADLPEGTGKQFIQGGYDCITFLGE